LVSYDSVVKFFDDKNISVTDYLQELRSYFITLKQYYKDTRGLGTDLPKPTKLMQRVRSDATLRTMAIELLRYEKDKVRKLQANPKISNAKLHAYSRIYVAYENESYELRKVQERELRLRKNLEALIEYLAFRKRLQDNPRLLKELQQRAKKLQEEQKRAQFRRDNPHLFRHETWGVAADKSPAEQRAIDNLTRDAKLYWEGQHLGILLWGGQGHSIVNPWGEVYDTGIGWDIIVILGGTAAVYKGYRAAKSPRRWTNWFPDKIDRELAMAAELNVRPIRITEPTSVAEIGANGRIFKWVLTDELDLLGLLKPLKGELVNGKPIVKEDIIKHVVATEGQPVLAAGNARLQAKVLLIDRLSGHFRPDKASLWLAKEIFEKAGFKVEIRANVARPSTR
jgi:hypothetical protein